jgi:hypothetical protein
MRFFYKGAPRGCGMALVLVVGTLVVVGVQVVAIFT